MVCPENKPQMTQMGADGPIFIARGGACGMGNCLETLKTRCFTGDPPQRTLSGRPVHGEAVTIAGVSCRAHPAAAGWVTAYELPPKRCFAGDSPQRTLSRQPAQHDSGGVHCPAACRAHRHAGLPMTCHCERLLRSNLPRMDEIASGLRPLAMTVIAGRMPLAPACRSDALLY